MILPLYLAMFLIAMSTLAFEFLLATLSSYLLGDSVLQFSVTVGVFMLALGMGTALAAKRSAPPVEWLLWNELAVTLIGGVSTLALYALYAKYSATVWVYTMGLNLLLLLLGVLFGASLPLLVRHLKAALSEQRTIGNLLSLDYLGGMAATILVPLLILPNFGIVRAALILGLVNGVTALLLLLAAWGRLVRPRLLLVAALALLGGLGALLGWSTSLLGRIEEELFKKPILLARQSPYQRIVLTRQAGVLQLYLNSHRQWSSADEHRYHEALVHPAMALARRRERILILGGGDGLAAREILKYPEVRHVLLVDIDPEVTKLARTDPLVSDLNRRSLLDPRLTIRNADAFKFLEDDPGEHDVIVVDFPDPATEELGKLYTRTFYRLLKKRLAPGGIMAMQATSIYYNRISYWCIVHSVRAAALVPHPYAASIPSFGGDAGFLLAAAEPQPLENITVAVPTRYLTPSLARSLFVLGKDQEEIPTAVNEMDTLVLVRYFTDESRQSYKYF